MRNNIAEAIKGKHAEMEVKFRRTEWRNVVICLNDHFMSFVVFFACNCRS